MLSWTPSVALLAFLLWQDGIGLEEGAADRLHDAYPAPETIVSKLCREVLS
jgi:hypothetical protein